MTLSYYDNGRPPRTRVVRALMVANVAFAALVLGAWTYVAFFIAEPISWATWSSLTSTGAPELFEYPFVILWALPITGSALAWIDLRMGNARVAVAGALIPILLLGLTFGWFYLAPAAWH